MRRITTLFAVSAVALSAASLLSPANAAPYHLIRWDNTGYCEIWDTGLAIKPVRWLSDYEVVSKRKATIEASLATKDRLLKRGVCKF
ncbi:MAG TPA: hypothetical protein VKY22_04265 [Bradyrhizobium sp.]|nr:hypothetical protein [Bradyrhizobium sp.]